MGVRSLNIRGKGLARIGIYGGVYGVLRLYRTDLRIYKGIGNVVSYEMEKSMGYKMEYGLYGKQWFPILGLKLVTSWKLRRP